MSFSKKHYRQWILLGEGGEARVFRARQVALDRLVAIREVKAHAASRAEREAQILAGLRHQGLATAIDFGYCKGRFHLVQDYVRGATADAVGVLPPLAVLGILRKLAAVLGFLHSHGLVHGDLNPGNILLSPAQGPVLIDFGMVHLLGERTGQAMGAPRYFSPEHFVGGPFTPASDIFSFAVLAHRLLTGKELFPQSDLGSLREAVDAGVYDYSQVLPEAMPVLAACLMTDSSRRPEDMEEVDELLEIAQQKLENRLGPVRAESERREAADHIHALARKREHDHLAESADHLRQQGKWKDAWNLMREMASLREDPEFLVPAMNAVQSHMQRQALGHRLLAVALAMAVLGAAFLAWERQKGSVPQDVDSGAAAALQAARMSRTPEEASDGVAAQESRRWVAFPDWDRYSEIWVDGSPVALSAGGVLLIPGTHKYRARLIGDSVWVEGVIGGNP